MSSSTSPSSCAPSARCGTTCRLTSRPPPPRSAPHRGGRPRGHAAAAAPGHPRRRVDRLRLHVHLVRRDPRARRGRHGDDRGGGLAPGDADRRHRRGGDARRAAAHRRRRRSRLVGSRAAAAQSCPRPAAARPAPPGPPPRRAGARRRSRCSHGGDRPRAARRPGRAIVARQRWPAHADGVAHPRAVGGAPGISTGVDPLGSIGRRCARRLSPPSSRSASGWWPASPSPPCGAADGCSTRASCSRSPRRP